MSIQDKGAVAFWLDDENHDWLQDDQEYNFPPLNKPPMSVQAPA